jgi:hypothetical protein
MECPQCGSKELLAVITIVRIIPLAQRGGSVKIGGQRLCQMDLRDAWDKHPYDREGPDKPIRGPIHCAECSAEMFHVTGAPQNPILGSYAEALERGPAHYRN